MTGNFKRIFGRIFSRAVINFDSGEQYITERWIENDDMDIHSSTRYAERILIPMVFGGLVEKNIGEWRITTVQKNANGDIVCYLYDRQSAKPGWVP